MYISVTTTIIVIGLSSSLVLLYSDSLPPLALWRTPALLSITVSLLVLEFDTNNLKLYSLQCMTSCHIAFMRFTHIVACINIFFKFLDGIEFYVYIENFWFIYLLMSIWIVSRFYILKKNSGNFKMQHVCLFISCCYI